MVCVRGDDRPSHRPPSALELFWAPLEVTAWARSALVGSLSAEERARMRRFRSPEGGVRYGVGRGWLRLLLGQRLGCSPEMVELHTGEGGKPQLVESSLQFSCSRSGAVVLFALSERISVGVDVEQIRPAVDMEALARRFFTARERAGLVALAPRVRAAAWHRCWTRKEAYLKGLGVGLRVPLSSLELWEPGDGKVHLGGWAVHTVEVAPGYAAAVAGEAHEWWVPEAPTRLAWSPNLMRPTDSIGA